MTKIDRRTLLNMLPAAAALPLARVSTARNVKSGARKPNVLFIMADQQRFDTIAALGNQEIYTPNLDRLVARGTAFTNAYSTCPVCVPARYTIRTGSEPYTTRIFSNAKPDLLEGQPSTMNGRCGPYLAETMRSLGYRTFGIGKFHTQPWDEPLGYDVHLHSEELYATPQQRRGDSYASWIAKQQPAYDFIEGLMGERTEMYYMPQMSPTPAYADVEGWAAQRAVEQLAIQDDRPYFGFISFIGPHPPFAPPIPFNRIYDPDRMPNPVQGEIAIDHMDEQLPFMNYAIWAEDVNNPHARVLKARYYGEITYIDHCIGQILDAMEKRGDAANTLICFYSDHGDHLGDHHAWQKESFFDVSCHVPFLVSWPEKLAAGKVSNELVCLTDLFGIATTAAGKAECRQGIDVLGILNGTARPRETLFGYYGEPGTRRFKIMARRDHWKYIWFANGDREQLFDLAKDPLEHLNLVESQGDTARKLKSEATAACNRPELRAVLDGNGLRGISFEARPLRRIYQFDRSRGVTGFPKRPEDVLLHFRFPTTTA
ncbi:MAG TPA: sulfatase-like hydrolase/transferase [Bryobacteraceae bacterium]